MGKRGSNCCIAAVSDVLELFLMRVRSQLVIVVRLTAMVARLTHVAVKAEGGKLTRAEPFGSGSE